MSNAYTITKSTIIKTAEGKRNLKREEIAITEEMFEAAEGDYQVDWERYLATPGAFYSSSTPEQKEIWNKALNMASEIITPDAGYEDTDNELGDPVDHNGDVHHFGCVEAGLEVCVDYAEDEEDQARATEMLKEWRAFYNEVEASWK